MKKRSLQWISLLVTIILIVSSLAACGGNAEETAKKKEGAGTEEAASQDTDSKEASSENDKEKPENSGDALPGEGKTVAILMHSVADEFIYAVYQAAAARAESYGFDIYYVDAKNDAATQTAAIEDAISKGVDAIMLCPVDAQALSDSVGMINEAGIPVTLADRTVEEGDYVAVCASDNVSCGYDGGVELAEAAKAQGIDVKDLKVVELQGDLASTSGLERPQGFQKAAEELGFEIVSSLPTYWESDTAYNAALDALQANSDINAMYLASDGVMADAVVSALEQVGKLKSVGEDGHIIITTVDGTPGVIDYIKEGYIDAVCAQPAITMANDAIDYLVKALDGEVEPNGKINDALSPVIGTKDNIDSDELWANTLE